MRFSSWIVFVMVALCSSGVAAQGAVKPSRTVVAVDRIVAVVNDEVITRLDLSEQLKLAADALKRQGTPIPPRNVLETQVLERMIAIKTQLQFAKEIGIKIDEPILDKTVARVAQNNMLSVDALRAALQKDGVSFAKFREDLRAEMIIARLREREVDSKIVVTEAEIEALLQVFQDSQARGDEYDLTHILVRVPEQASPEQIKQRQARAEEALEKIRKGANFGEIAASYSDAPEALKGGGLGWREANRLPALFVDALKGMRVGETSPLLRSANGFHIIKLVDQRGAAPVIVQQTNARHILIRTNELISEAEARNRLLGLRERIDNGADFAEIARLHSQDGSASKGVTWAGLRPAIQCRISSVR